MEGFQDDPGDPQADGDDGYQQGLALNVNDIHEDRYVDGNRSQDEQRSQKYFELDVPRPFFRAAKPTPDEGREEGADDGDDGQVDRFFGEL